MYSAICDHELLKELAFFTQENYYCLIALRLNDWMKLKQPLELKWGSHGGN